MSDEGDEQMDTHVVVPIHSAMATQLLSDAHGRDVMSTNVGALKNGMLTMDGTGECEIKLLGPNGLILANPGALPTSTGGNSPQTATLTASLVDTDVEQLSVGNSQAEISSHFQPSLIYVGQGEAQLADQGLLLTGESVEGQSLSLDHGQLIAGSDVVEGEGTHELQSVEEGAEDHLVLQAGGVTMEDGSKLVTLSPQSLGISGHLLQQSSNLALSWPESAVFQSNQLKNLVLKTATGESIQVIAVQNLMPDLAKNSGSLIQIGQEGSSSMSTQLVQAGNMATLLSGNMSIKPEDDNTPQVIDFATGMPIGESLTGILVSGTVPQRSLPPGTPQWAARINDCEKIGDSYRGWVETEMDLDLLLTYHKQQTHSFWGTRQSPSPAKPSTRLMWKSQYVPFDGIPFVNAGSRAIVLECQFGPRRKGVQSKRQTEDPKGLFKQTCPARIYIKKVKKFPEYAVDTTVDKKVLKLNMDKAFMAIRDTAIATHGQERYYVQLPTEDGHEFHSGSVVESPHRLDSKVADKIRELVANGETRLYAIRKALRKYVEKELFSSAEEVPEKHNLTFYPTVNDLQNHIHQAVRDIEAGVLPVIAPTVKVEVIDQPTDEKAPSDNLPAWQQLTPSEGQPHTESVTVTLTQNPGEDGQHVISKVETHLSDGTTQVTTNLTPETARLLSKLHPNMFPGEAVLPDDDLGGTTLPEQMAEASLNSIHSADQLAEHMGVVPNAQTQYVVMEKVADSESSLVFGGEGTSVGGVDQHELQIHGVTDARHDGDLNMIETKLVNDEEIDHYDPHCMSLGSTGMSSTVDPGLGQNLTTTGMDESLTSTDMDESMASTDLDKSMDAVEEEINVLQMQS